MKKKKEELEKLKLLQPPKKRGRKPKGGQIIKNKINIQETSIDNKIIILHLKCKLSDIDDNIKDITTYNPFLEKVVPYENININYTKVNTIIDTSKIIL